MGVKIIDMRIYSPEWCCLSFAFSAIGIFTAVSAQARWAKPEDVDYSIVYRNYDAWIHKDGTYDEVLEDETLVLKDSARMSRGVVRLNYNPEVSKFEVLSAETINGTQHIPVDPKLIEDKPLASSGEGFDQWHQVMIAFPGVDVGSLVHLKYKLSWKHVPVPDFYSAYYYYGYEYQKAGTLTLHSALPLFTDVNDPQKYLAISSSRHKDKDYPYWIQVKLRRPVLKNVVDEPDPFLDPATLPSVTVASSRDWGEVAKPVLSRYEAILNSKLPPMFSEIADRARKIADPVARMNFVTSRLSDQMRYLGDWRTVNGQWIPRNLNQIARTKFGDCKDFSASLAAILRHIGMNADVAWTWRGWSPVIDSYKLPSNYRFNHAVTRVKVGDQIYWLDGTNVASYAQGIPGDISDRPALLLDPKDPELVHIPAPPISDFAYSFHQRLDFSDPDGVRVEGTFLSHGGDALSWVNGNYNASQSSLNYDLIRAAAHVENFKKWKVQGFHIHSRVVKDLHARFHYIDEATGFRSTAGLAYPIIPPDAVDRLLFNTDQRASDIVLGEPFSYERDMLFTHMTVVGQESLACAVNTPWVRIDRKIAQVADGLEVQDHLTLKKALLRHKDYTSAAFAKLQKKLVHCFRYSTVVYQPKKPTIN